MCFHTTNVNLPMVQILRLYMALVTVGTVYKVRTAVARERGTLQQL